MLQQDFQMRKRMLPLANEPAESLDVLAYRSVAVSPPSEADLQNLVKVSQCRNKTLGLTGVLLYDNGTFFQWLEGSHEGLDQVWRSIERDPRHRDITVLRREPLSTRAFDGWDLKFAKGSRVRVEAAVAAMDSSERLERVLGNKKSILNLSLADLFTAEVLPRLAKSRLDNALSSARRLSTAKIWHAASDTADTLAHLLIRSAPTDTATYIDSLLDQGAGFQALYQEVFEPAQIQLGKLWDNDVCNDWHLSMGLARLQMELRRVDFALQCVPAHTPGHSVLLSPQPREAHLLTVAMSSQAFERCGWHVTCEFPHDDQSLADLVRERWFDVLKLSLSGAVRRDSRLAAMRVTIDLVREQSLNPCIAVIVDGRTFIERPKMFRAVHADAMSINVLQSVAVAAHVLRADRAPTVSGQVTPA